MGTKGFLHGETKRVSTHGDYRFSTHVDFTHGYYRFSAHGD